MSELSIKVNIAGRTYPLTIQRDEEELVRKAAKSINDNIENLQNNYAIHDKVDLLAMTALQFANKSSDVKEQVVDEKLTEEIAALNNTIETYLSK